MVLANSKIYKVIEDIFHGEIPIKDDQFFVNNRLLEFKNHQKLAAYYSAYSHFNKVMNPKIDGRKMIIFRGVNPAYDKSSIGESWTTNINKAFPYHAGTNNGNFIIIRASFSPEQINWNDTVQKMFCMYCDEYEVVVNKGSVINEFAIFPDKFSSQMTLHRVKLLV